MITPKNFFNNFWQSTIESGVKSGENKYSSVVFDTLKNLANSSHSYQQRRGRKNTENSFQVLERLERAMCPRQQFSWQSGSREQIVLRAKTY